MLIESPLHARILESQKQLVPRKTRFKASNGEVFLFVRVDTKFWPFLVVLDERNEQHEWDDSEVRKRAPRVVENEIIIEPLEEFP